MSLGREFFDDYGFEIDFPFGVPGEYWKSKNGRIKVTEMTDAHIQNCMNIVGEDDEWYGYFVKELERRKENKGWTKR